MMYFVQECNATEIYCDAGMDSEGCWYGNYCLNQVGFDLDIATKTFNLIL